MLRNIETIRSYPSKSVYEDLLTRVGPPTKDSWSPFTGMAEIIDHQFTGIARDRFNLEEFIEYARHDSGDLNPSKVNTVERETDGIMEASTNAGYVTLDDMVKDKDAVKRSLTYAIIGYKRNAASPYTRNNAHYTRAFVDDETGRIDSENEQRVMDVDYGRRDYQEVIEEIPYLLKIMHKFSCSEHYQLFSFLRAYACLIEVKPKASLKNSDYAAYTTYRLKSNGVIERAYNAALDNRGTEFPAARKFIEGGSPDDPAYKAAMRLLADFDILGLNIKDEDPALYSGDNIQRIVCRRLTPNEEYFKDYKNVDPELAAALQAENLYKTGRHITMFEDDTQTMDINRFMECVRIELSTLMVIEPKMFDSWSDKNYQVIKYVSDYYNYLTFMRTGKTSNISFNRNDFTYCDGILLVNGDWLKLEQNIFDCNSSGFFAISEYGFAIRIDPIYDSLYFIPIEDLIESLEKRKKGDSDYGIYWRVK